MMKKLFKSLIAAFTTATLLAVMIVPVSASDFDGQDGDFLLEEEEQGSDYTINQILDNYYMDVYKKVDERDVQIDNFYVIEKHGFTSNPFNKSLIHVDRIYEDPHHYWIFGDVSFRTIEGYNLLTGQRETIDISHAGGFWGSCVIYGIVPVKNNRFSVTLRDQLNVK